jgi:cell wall-associated NlpC family hydrolase
MRRPLLICLAAFLAATLAAIAFFFVPETSRAAPPPSEGGASQGTFTRGATAGPNEPSLVDGTGPRDSVRSDAVVTTEGRRLRRGVLRVARWHIGTPYRPSPPGPCRRFRSEDCSCFTKLVFNTFGKKLPDSPTRQWQYGRKVTKSHLRRGDLVFFKEAGRNRPITHVGIYSGRGNLVHASAYFGKVVESKMKYIRGYSGAKRLTKGLR